jgi:predicted RNA-binding protein
MARTYWLDLFTVETWKEFRDHGSEVSGFRESRWATLQKVKPGDYLLCYLTRVSRWVGLLEVTGEPFFDEEPIWSSQAYPSRVRVRAVVALPPEHGVPVLGMREELTVFQGLDNPNRWSGPFRGSPRRWKPADGEAVVRALQDAEANPVERPLGRLGKRPDKGLPGRSLPMTWWSSRRTRSPRPSRRPRALFIRRFSICWSSLGLRWASTSTSPAMTRAGCGKATASVIYRAAGSSCRSSSTR